MGNGLLLINLHCYLSMKDFVENDYNYNPSLGHLAIVEYVKMHGFEASAIDYNFAQIDYVVLEDTIRTRHIGYIGITAYTENLNMVFKFLRTVKKMFPEIVTIVGGPHATLKPEEVVKSRFVDYVTSRDGESTMLELLLHLEYGDELIHLSDIEGLYTKDMHNNARENVTDLSLLPIINRENAEIDRYKSVVTLYSSKGCPGRCIYCAATTISGARYRIRNVYSIFMECWLIYHQLGESVDRLFFIDDTFTVHKKRTKEFCTLVTTHKLPLLWSCESRIDVIDHTTIDMFAKSRCYAVQFGVESGNQAVLDTIKKQINLDHLVDIVGYADRYDMEIYLGFMIGHYPDTAETMQDTINFIRRMLSINKHIRFSVSVNTPFPGTWQYEHADEIGLTIFDPDYSHYNLVTPVIETRNFDRAMLLEFFNQANSVKYNGGKRDGE